MRFRSQIVLKKPPELSVPPASSVTAGEAVAAALPKVSVPAKVTVPPEIVAVLPAVVGPATGLVLVVSFVQPALGQVPSPPFQL